MTADKIRQQDSTELKTGLAENEEQLFRLRFQLGMGQTEGVKKYRELRRDRARMLGVLRERELDPAKAAAAEQAAAAGKKSTSSKGKKK
jgi:large subunit ribosomal protein L29